MKVLRKLCSLFRRNQLEREMAEEMRLHLELQTEKNIAVGMEADEAQYAAKRQFGGVEQIKERCREQRSWVWLEQLWRDTRFALRHLLKTPRFSAVAVVSLGLGIGVSTALFSLLDARLWRSVPVADPESLTLFEWAPASAAAAPHEYDFNGGIDGAPSTGQAWLHFPRKIAERFAQEHELLSQVSVTANLFAMTVTVDGIAEFVPEGLLVSGNYYPMLAVSAWRGRLLAPEDDLPGAAPACVISHAYWQRRFGAENVVGRTIMVNRVPVTIVGVTPPNFRGVLPIGYGPDIVLPVTLAERTRRDSKLVANPNGWWVRIIARRQPGVSLEQARAGLENTFRAGAQELSAVSSKGAVPRLFAVPAGRLQLPGALRWETTILVPIAGMAILVLFAACANVATMQVARGAARRRELATCLALGASRARIVRRLLIESLLLSLAGAALGVLFSRWNLEALTLMFPRATSGYAAWVDPESLVLDLRVLGFAAVSGLVTGLIFGLSPALRATRINLIEEFQGGPRAPGGVLSRTGQALVGVQVVAACVLLIGAGLFSRSVQNLEAIDLGFDRHRVLMFATDAQSAGVPANAFSAIPERIADCLRGLPGVREVSYSGWPVLTGEGGPFSSTVSVPGIAREEKTLWNQVGPTFLETYRIPLVAGRNFETQDERADVAIVNEVFAERFFPHESPIGRVISLHARAWRIVGIMRNSRQTTSELRGPVEPLVLIPFAQHPQQVARFAIRTVAEPLAIVPDIRKALRDIVPNLAPAAITTQEEQVGWRFFIERMFARVAGFVGAIALALASVGLSGLISHSVVRRTNEIGIRMALGARPGAVLRMILRQSLSVVAVGLVVGLSAAAALARLIAGRLFGLTPLDPITYAVVATILVAVSLLACWLPARRATKVDPVAALRAE